MIRMKRQWQMWLGYLDCVITGVGMVLILWYKFFHLAKQFWPAFLCYSEQKAIFGSNSEVICFLKCQRWKYVRVPHSNINIFAQRYQIWSEEVGKSRSGEWGKQNIKVRKNWNRSKVQTPWHFENIYECVSTADTQIFWLCFEEWRKTRGEK